MLIIPPPHPPNNTLFCQYLFVGGCLELMKMEVDGKSSHLALCGGADKIIFQFHNLLIVPLQIETSHSLQVSGRSPSDFQ